MTVEDQEIEGLRRKIKELQVENDTLLIKLEEMQCDVNLLVRQVEKMSKHLYKQNSATVSIPYKGTVS
jgi:predicted RNase H-like nuclease (RuvC/YqgF family)